MRFLFFLFILPFLCLGQTEDTALRNELWTGYAKAELLFNKEAYTQAQSIFEPYLKEHPNDQKTIEYLGDIAGYAEDWDTAISYYKKLVVLAPENANYHYKYGGALGMKALSINRLKALGLLGDIKESFLTAATLDPNHIEVRWALVELYIQLPGIVGGSETKSIKYANELATLSEVDGHLANGYIAEYNDRPLDAEQHYRSAVEVGGSITCYTKLSEHYEKNDAPDKALETIEEARQKHKSSNRLHYQLGKIAGQYGIGLDQGIECLGNYIKNYTTADGVPKDWAYYRLAQIYRHKGDRTKATEWINKALADRADFKEALTEKKLISQL